MILDLGGSRVRFRFLGRLPPDMAQTRPDRRFSMIWGLGGSGLDSGFWVPPARHGPGPTRSSIFDDFGPGRYRVRFRLLGHLLPDVAQIPFGPDSFQPIEYCLLPTTLWFRMFLLKSVSSKASGQGWEAVRPNVSCSSKVLLHVVIPVFPKKSYLRGLEDYPLVTDTPCFCCCAARSLHGTFATLQPKLVLSSLPFEIPWAPLW